MPDHLDSLSLEQRVELYRRRAGRMMVLADACKSETMKLAYLKLAAHWQELILDIQHIPARSMLEQKSGSALGGSFSAREGRRVR